MEMSKRTQMRFARLKKCAEVDNAMDDLTDIFNATLKDVLTYIKESGNTEISKQWASIADALLDNCWRC